MKRFSFLIFLISALGWSAAQAQAIPPAANATIAGNKGESFGQVTVSELPRGLLVHLELRGLPAGWHAAHFHAVGNCSTSDFSSAGSHATHGMQGHGFRNATGPHLGDLPNIYVHSDSLALAEYFLPAITLEELLDSDGAAFIVHATADDYTTQPSGMAGERIACGALVRS